MLETGTKAPDFKLEDKDGNLVSLSDFKNKKVVLDNFIQETILLDVLSKHAHLEIIMMLLN